MSTLRDVIREMIALEGPMSVERYMGLALGHPALGYYVTRDPFGAAGDFTTAPEISQMFGELIGLWAAQTWTDMGAPASLRFVELGPGRGTLMDDALRAARALPAFRAALDVHLVETSPMLRARQRERLRACDRPVSWHARIEDVPPGPMIVIANEFFDALPVRQFVRTQGGWCERLVGLDDGGALRFGLFGECEVSLRAQAPEGAVLEINTAARAIMGTIAARLVAQGGAALIVDYGSMEPGFGDTLQAVAHHSFADPLSAPGQADLTAHVDFAALADAARGASAATFGPVTQGAFLARLGITERAAVLACGGDPTQVAAARDRLTADRTPQDMGCLFKVLCVAQPGLRAPAGFEEIG